MMNPCKGTFRFNKIVFLVPFMFSLVLEFVASEQREHSEVAPPPHWREGPPSPHSPYWQGRPLAGDGTKKNDSSAYGHPHINNSTNPASRHQNSKPLADTYQPHRRLVHVGIIIAAVLLVLVFVFLLVFCHRRSRAVNPLEAASNNQQKTSSIRVPLLKRSELESACESFSNIVGSLSDSLLYKGTLSSGVEIAVSSIKLDKPLDRLSEAQFRKKIAILSKVNHRNFVNLLGYCEDNPLTRMLAFEYVPNGTLFEHLHTRESVGLGWDARMRIAVGVACCLDYMHQLSPPIILHNLDTNLIYLTDDYAAKIADLELWTDTSEGGTVLGSSTALLKEVPDKGGIVQKFGIVLFELLSGKDPRSQCSGPAEIWAWDLLNLEAPLKDMVDPELESVPDDRAAAVLQLIKQCLNPESEHVLSMKKVASRLKEITGISPKNAAPLGYDLDFV